jgi:hypothetical protein
MEPERWGQIERLFESALEHDESERAAFLERACAGDDALRQEVASLLAQQSAAAGFIEVPAVKLWSPLAAQDHDSDRRRRDDHHRPDVRALSGCKQARRRRNGRDLRG